MKIDYMPRHKQAPGDFNEGEILELRPVIPENNGGGFRSYSNLFYWAHAWSDDGSTIGLHPHKGFEIMSYVVKGSLEHYDTLLKKWIPLEQGAIQIIRSGRGISHSEKINKGSHMFQIWFDPGLEQSMKKPATYDDFELKSFPVIEKNNLKRTIIRGEGSPLKMDSPNRIERWDFSGKEIFVDIPQGWMLSWFQIKGETVLNGTTLIEEDFARITDTEKAKFEIKDSSAANSHSAFLIWTPAKPGYRTYFG